MMESIIMLESERPPALNGGAGHSQSEASPNNKLEALTVLANALLREIEVLKQTADCVVKMRISDEVHRFESELIRSALIQTGGRQRPAARLLGMKATTLHTKIKRYNIKLKRETY